MIFRRTPAPEPASAATPGENRQGAAWLLADMLLVTAMLGLVKHEAATFPPIQLVFIRSLVGLIAVAPIAWRYRSELLHGRRLGGHLFRVACNTLALTCNFFAVSALPLALVTAIGFTRPLALLALAALMLGERIGPIRWAAAGIGFVGILVMSPPEGVSSSLGFAAALGSVLFGSLAIVQTRRLRSENTHVLMLFYTLGLSLLTSIPAAISWTPVPPGAWIPLLAIGVLAQLGQYCFLRAHQTADTRYLAPLGYLSIVLATAVGFAFFGETPRLATFAGVAIILLALYAGNRLERLVSAPDSGRRGT
ncbi:DMT family transporter [Inquilinus sp. CAU 1745]|uniref:DMT family transporter n=1 Tax=Inquilinus sp. CAU 1745 TaxID=3140369 RepID=UPI00325B2E41